MRLQHQLWALTLMSLSACGAKATEEESDRQGLEEEGSDTGGTQADDDAMPTADDDPPAPVTTPRVPKNHRAAAEVCDRVRPPGNVASSGGSYEGAPCQADADCTAGINGRCINLRGPACTYDVCFEDSECSSGGPCGCEQGTWTEANACMDGNCQVDADCGDGGYCSPSFGSCGNYLGVVAYWCRTPSDTCVEDTDCIDPTMGAGFCAFFPEVGYWSCNYGQCVG